MSPQYVGIVDFSYQSTLIAGDPIVYTVKVVNIYGAPFSAWAEIELIWGGFSQYTTRPGYHAYLQGGQQATFQTSTTSPLRVPPQSAVVNVYSLWYGDDGQWHRDDFSTYNLIVVGQPPPPPPPLTATITDKWINKGSLTRIPIPYSMAIPDGVEFELGARWKNTSSAAGNMKALFQVWDPDGDLVKSQESSYYNLAAGESIEWERNIVRITKAGTWLASIQIRDPSGNTLASFHGTCLNVSGTSTTDVTITDKRINKAPEGNNLPMPLTTYNDNNTFEVTVYWRNSHTTQLIKVKPSVVVTTPSPNPTTIVGTPEASLIDTPAGQTKSRNFNISHVNKPGIWKVLIQLRDQNGGLLTSYEGDCLIVQGATGQITAMWFNQGSHRNAPFGGEVNADGQTFEIGVRFRNTYNRNIMASVEAEAWDPSGLKQVTPPIDWPLLGIPAGQELSTVYPFGRVDRPGEWTARLTLKTRDDNATIDVWPGAIDKGLLFRALTVATISSIRITGYRKKGAGTSAAAIDVTDGDVVEVDVQISYSAPAARNVDLKYGLYIPLGFDYPLQYQVELDAGENKTKNVALEIPIRKGVGLKNKTYHLRAELLGLSSQIDNAVIVTGVAEGIIETIGDIGALIGMMVMVMMMSFMMEFIKEPAKTIEKVVETGKKVAEAVSPVVQIFLGDSEKKSGTAKRVITQKLEDGEVD